jgi:energy-converting hydrogenase Eha subunit E
MTPEATLGTALLAYAGANGLVGLFMLTFPRALWVSIGGAEGQDLGEAYASTRFAGAMMVILAMMALLVIRKPARQSTTVTLLCLEETLVGVALFINAVADDVPTSGWFTWLIALGSIALAGFMWWARIVGRKALKEASGQ